MEVVVATNARVAFQTSNNFAFCKQKLAVYNLISKCLLKANECRCLLSEYGLVLHKKADNLL